MTRLGYCRLSNGRSSLLESMETNRKDALNKAIQTRAVLRFTYNGKARVVEPQAYGLSTAGNEVLRGFQREGSSQSGQAVRLKLFEVAKILNLQITEQHFDKARPEHNPDDSAMVVVFAALPRTS